MWGITGINFRTSIVFNLLLFFILFADDTNLFMSHKNLNALIVKMNIYRTEGWRWINSPYIEYFQNTLYPFR